MNGKKVRKMIMIPILKNLMFLNLRQKNPQKKEKKTMALKLTMISKVLDYLMKEEVILLMMTMMISKDYFKMLYPQY